MSEIIVNQNRKQSLFRAEATRAVGYRIFSGVTVVVPPSAGIGLLVGMLVVMAMIAVVVTVEIPQRSKAVGVLMPAGGLIDVVANEPGRVLQVFAQAGEAIAGGGLLLTVAGGEGSAKGQSLSAQTLNSMNAELALRENAYVRSQKIASDRSRAAEDELSAAVARQHIGRDRLQSHDELMAILEHRLARRQQLLLDGHVAQDAFDVEYAAVMSARASRADIEQRTFDLAQGIRTLKQRQVELTNQRSLDELSHQIEIERLQRHIVAANFNVSGEYRALESGHVAHLFVQPGVAVHAGQVLAKLRRSTEHMEAWLYVSTAQARMMQPGQTVEIRLDAYPQQVFGTFTATVSSVSGVALLPREITVPLLISGPVFEIRARLDDADIEVDNEVFLLQPGISFKADIVRQRLKLYEWLLLSLTRKAASEAGDGRA